VSSTVGTAGKAVVSAVAVVDPVGSGAIVTGDSVEVGATVIVVSVETGASVNAGSAVV